MPFKKFKKYRKLKWGALTLLVFHIIGFFSSFSAIMEARSPQSATGWVIALNTIPVVSVPAYWSFGKPSFVDYAEAKTEQFREYELPSLQLKQQVKEQGLAGRIDHLSKDLVGGLTGLPPTRGNAVELLVNGEAAFDSIFEGIRAAEDYVIVHFFTIADDDVGTRLADALKAKAAEGVACYVLYDALGSKLKARYLDPLSEAGIQLCAFNDFAGLTKLYRMNFRNHRKLIIVDGKYAWIGGMNLKESYLKWRDTMVRFEGPVVQAFQKTFVEDWVWCAEEPVRGLNWEMEPASAARGTAHVASVPSGPADPLPQYSQVTLDAIYRAESRIWIASPYFVPSEEILDALSAAAVRGVEVKILIPDEVDTKLAELARIAAWSYIRELEAVGAQVYQYTSPFMHQKVILADDDFVLIGSSNFDSRSLFLNFELMAAVSDKTFNAEVAEMLTTDLERTTAVTYEAIEGKSYWDRLLIRTARLAAPLL